MASIASLLNPEPQEVAERRKIQLPTPCSSGGRIREPKSPPPPRQKKQKVSKDAAVFTRGKPRGEVRYPPCEFQDAELAKWHEKFEIHPMGSISEYPRHIPYNSEKKSFLEKTGRESFEVFQYNFKVEGHDKTFLMMWDYNVGLVRTTPLFRCNNYSKTAPAKMLNQNPGLREVCHSITGGALAAQGYWMPFEAAKAVAATFCYNIRYALTPIFGVEFLSMCVHPNDPLFARMVIDRSIIEAATESAQQYRLLEAPLARSHLCPTMNFEVKEFPRLKNSRAEEVDSDYGTDSDASDKNVSYSTTRNLGPRTSAWTPANVPRSHTLPKSRPTFSSPREILVAVAAGQTARKFDFSSQKRSIRKRHTLGASLTPLRRTDTNDNARVLDIDDDSELNDEDIIRASTDHDNEDTDSETFPSEQEHGSDDTPGNDTDEEVNVNVPGCDDGDKDCDDAESTGCRSPLPLNNDRDAAFMLMRIHMRGVAHAESREKDHDGETEGERVDNEEAGRKRRRASA